MKNFILMVFVACIMAGCSITAKTRIPDRVILDDGKIIIDDDGYGHSDGRFCPPGQAKKGRC